MKQYTVTAFVLVAVLTVLAWRIGDIYFSAPREGGIRLVIGDATAYRGSRGNRVEISLENPDTEVRGIQLEMCDVDNYLSCTGCEVTDRISGFTCASNEKPNGCYELILFSFTRLIARGSGPLVSFSCDVAEKAPGDACRALFPGRLEIADEKKRPLEASVEKGTICFKNCGTPADCADALWCYESHSCVDGVCRGIARCPDDGLYCNGREYCDEEARQCRRSPEPCAYCYDDGCRCDEEKDRCIPSGGAAGDSV